MEKEIKKSAVDLTDLAIGIIVLGIAVSIGATILIAQRDSRLTDLPVITTANETVTTVNQVGDTLANTWVKGISYVANATGNVVITSDNYTLTIGSGGEGVIKSTGANPLFNNTNWKVTYTWYNTSQVDWAVANDAATGIGEYGNWFKIIVIVGVASVVLAIIFTAFGNRGSSAGGVSY